MNSARLRAASSRRRGVLLIATALVVVFGADGIFRWYEARYLVEEVRFDDSRFDLARFGHNDEIGYIERERPRGELRILSVGDSFTLAVTVARLTYSAVLGRELADRLPGRTVRVVNLGQPVRSFDDYLHALHYWRSRVEFDAVLVNLYTGNDFRETPPLERGVSKGAPPFLAAERASTLTGPGTRVPHEMPLRLLDYWIANSRGSRWSGGPSYRPTVVSGSPDQLIRSQAKMLPIFRLDSLRDFASAQGWLARLLAELERMRAGGTAVAVSIAPPDFIVHAEWRDQVLAAAGLTATDIDPDLPASLIRGVAERVGAEFPLIDLRPCLQRAESNGERMYYGSNTHWSVRGNAVVGSVLAVVLADAWLGLPPGEPLECRTRPPEPQPALTAYLDTLMPARRAPRR